MTKKTTTQILISLESDVKYIKQAIQSYSYKIDLLLNKLNNLPSNSIEDIKKISITEQQQQNNILPKEEEDYEFKTDPSQFDNNSVSFRAVDELEMEQDADGNFEVREDPNPAPVRRTNRVPVQTDIKKIQVQQKILYPDGDHISLASVNIFTKEGKLIKSTRTNGFGKWIAALIPGSYVVKINKGKLKDKVAVGTEFNIDIPNSDKPIELSSIKAG